MPTNERKREYDLVRAFASLLVVGVHAGGLVDRASPLISSLFTFISIITIASNALFFFMSGYFSLRKEPTGTESVVRFYLRRFRSVVIPLVVFSLVRAVYAVQPWLGQGDVWTVLKTYVKGVLLGFAGTEYWFVYTLAGFLLAAPVLARAVAHMSRGEKYVVLIVGLAYNAAVSIFRNLGYSPAWGYLLSGWALTFVAGAFVADLFDTPRKRHALYVASVVSYVGTALLYDAGVRTTMTDTSPLFTVYVLGLYVALLQLGRRLRPSKIVSFAAENAFCVYLVHFPVLGIMRSLLPTVMGALSLPWYVFVTVVVYFMSLFIGLAVENVAVRPLQQLYDRAIGQAESFLHRKMNV